MKQFFWVLLATLALAACSSGVKLDNVAVEDRTGTPLTPGGAGAVGGGAAASGVTSVDVGKTVPMAAIPAGPRIVYFDFDSFVIKPEFQSVIEAHARYINTDKTRKVAIEGHTDERGGREYNLSLGQKRAEAVRNALRLSGVADSQLEAVSFGKEKPAAAGSDEDAMAKNRRAEISYR